MNPNWPRWIKASIYLFFQSEITGTTVFFEGTARRTEDKKDFVEVRIDGPITTELSKGYWQLEVIIDTLIMSKHRDDDIYAIDRILGNVLAAYPTDIPVFMYGDGVDDSPSTQLGCLKLDPTVRDSIRITQFGQPNIKSNTHEMTVEATYRMNLTTTTTNTSMQLVPLMNIWPGWVESSLEDNKYEIFLGKG